MIAGRLKIIKVFREHKGRGVLVGAKVMEGRLKATLPLVPAEGNAAIQIKVESIKQGQDSVETVARGIECGIILMLPSPTVILQEGTVLLQYASQ